jgi:hypothetical protein
MKVRMAVAMTSVVPSIPSEKNSRLPDASSLHLVILTDNGRLYLVEGYPSKGEMFAWRWRVLGPGIPCPITAKTHTDSGALLAPIMLGMVDAGLSSQVRGQGLSSSARRVKTGQGQGQGQASISGKKATAMAWGGREDLHMSIGGPYAVRSCSIDGEMNLFAVTGIDGAIRMYDWNILMSKYYSRHVSAGFDQGGECENKWLRARPPHGKTVSSRVLYTEGESTVTSTSKSHSSQQETKTISLAFHTVSGLHLTQYLLMII